MELEFALGDQVEKVGGDYRYDGEVRGIVIKKSGKPRFVVEDDRGVLFIFNSSQIKKK